MVAIFSVLLGAALACPGSMSPVHAGANIKVTFQNSCADVAEEIKMRASNNQNGMWTDPHNKGRYTLLQAKDDNSYVLIKRTTANGVFTDKADFTLTSTGSGCEVAGCSESQGISAADKGTNVCNMFDLFCNSQDCSGGNCCKVLKNDLQYQITKQSCYPLFFSCPGSQANIQKTCLQNPSTEAELLELQSNAIMMNRMGAFKALE